MKTLSKVSAQAKIKQDNDALIATNIRLRKYESDIIARLNSIKETYEPEKLERLKEFERFCKDIQAKESKLLLELAQIDKAISDKKDVYYGLIEKSDLLQEQEHQITESNKKLELRQTFVEDLEQKWRNKQP